MKIYKDGEVVKESGPYDIGSQGGLPYFYDKDEKYKTLPIFNIPFFGPFVSAKGVADKLEPTEHRKPRPPYMLERLTEQLREELETSPFDPYNPGFRGLKHHKFKKQKEPTWNINNPLKGTAKIAKNVGMFGGALGVSLINSLVNDVFGALARKGSIDKSIRANAGRDKSKDFDIRRIFFPNKFKKKEPK